MGQPRWCGAVGRWGSGVGGSEGLARSLCLSLPGLLSPPHPWYFGDHPQLQEVPVLVGNVPMTHRLRGLRLYLWKACVFEWYWFFSSQGILRGRPIFRHVSQSRT